MNEEGLNWDKAVAKLKQRIERIKADNPSQHLDTQQSLVLAIKQIAEEMRFLGFHKEIPDYHKLISSVVPSIMPTKPTVTTKIPNWLKEEPNRESKFMVMIFEDLLDKLKANPNAGVDELRKIINNSSDDQFLTKMCDQLGEALAYGELEKSYSKNKRGAKHRLKQRALEKKYLTEVRLDEPIPIKKLPEIKNNFDTVGMDEIYDYFNKELVKKQYLAEEVLIDYLKTAFDQIVIPKTLFKITNAPTKQKVMTVFYNYYKKIANKPHGKAMKYAGLLGDYFEGYNKENVYRNWSK